MSAYPTEWQRKVLWGAATALAIVGIGVVAVWLFYQLGRFVGFLQPVLTPFAVAAVLAYLLDPIVRTITSCTRLTRTPAVVVVLALLVLVATLLLIAVVPQIYNSSARVVRDMPAYTLKAQQRLLTLVEASERQINQLRKLFPEPKPSPGPEENASPSPAETGEETIVTPPATMDSGEASPAVVPLPAVSPSPAAGDAAVPASMPTPAGSPAATTGPADTALLPEDMLPVPIPEAAAPPPSASPGTTPAATSNTTPAAAPDTTPAASPTPAVAETPTPIRDYIQNQLPIVSREVPMFLNTGWHLLLRSIGGFLGVAGLLLNAVIIPVYLYFLLVESRNIARNWTGFLPLHDSPLKQEVVSVILEINGYLVAFFRGQLIVSTVDGLLIGGSLYLFLHLDFSFFIGLLVLVLTFIPYLGFILCYIPAILIAVVQFGDFWHPLYVVVIMFIVQTLESTIISPKIVGDSVGLHPMTVIISVFGWSLLLGGPIGALLAVPLTATLKVLMRRYAWERGGTSGRHFIPLTSASAATLDEVCRHAREGDAGQKAGEAASRNDPARFPEVGEAAPAVTGSKTNGAAAAGAVRDGL